MTRLAVSVAVAVGLALAGCSAEPEPVQYPPGQRPCNEWMRATDTVVMARLGASGTEDPGDRIRDALEAAKVPLRNRAGESAYYSAAEMDAAADAVRAAIDPLIEAYDAQEDVPYELPEFASARAAYDAADRRLTDLCNS